MCNLIGTVNTAGPALPVPTEPGRRALGPGQRGRRCWPPSAASRLLPRAKAAHSAGFRGQCKTLLVCQLFPVKWFHFSLSSLLGGTGWGATTLRMRQTFSRILCASCTCPSCLQAPRAFHCSRIRPTAPHQNPLGVTERTTKIGAYPTGKAFKIQEGIEETFPANSGRGSRPSRRTSG